LKREVWFALPRLSLLFTFSCTSDWIELRLDLA
jgi:hypothetical protein